ncbi:hypothetical protein [Actinoplanes sp. M2I2]|uniref:hypothetical protein n=1 Tax=Actinoplanes sp. M2I2 TaxID=1734444 RepID=UPI002020D490|nr:hypothetical protein [Actinoplanes sp. M2I2]
MADQAPGPDGLERQLRRLLLAYPPGPRRDELLDTILEGEEEGTRRRPAARQALNLMRHGMRARLGHPRSRAVVVIATLVTVLAGVFGAAAAASPGWALAPSLPQGVTSDELKREVFPGLTVWGGGDAARWVRTGDGEGWQYGFADHWVRHTAETRDVVAYATQVRDRLAANGWTIRGGVEFTGPEPDDVPPASRSATFWATRDGLTLHFDDTVVDKKASWDSEGSVTFALSRSAPAVLWLIALAGGLVAALLGWLMTGWVARRVEGRRLLRAITVLSATIGLTLLLPLAAFVALYATGGDDTPGPADELFFLGLRGILHGLWQPALVFACVMLLLAATPRRSERSQPARIAAFGLAAAALVAAGFADRAPRLADSASAAGRACVLATPAWKAPSTDRLAYGARVFIRPETTAERRNLIEAAIFRVPGAWGSSFAYDPASLAYREAYCDGAPLPAGAGPELPYFWDVDLSSPGVLPGLAAEVGALPGVLAVEPATTKR